MKYNLVTNVQLIFASTLMGLIAGLVTVSYLLWQDYRTLPIVVKTQGGQCVKVINFINGHAFTCNDVDVILRQYRTVIDK